MKPIVFILTIIFLFLVLFIGGNSQIIASDKCDEDGGAYINTYCVDKDAILWEKNDVQN